MRAVILGTGYVGLNTAAALAYLGHDIVGVDTDKQKIDLLQKKIAPIQEEGLTELLQLGLKLQFSQNLSQAIEEAEIIFIAVGTPSQEDGKANLSYVYEAAQQLSQLICTKKDLTIVVKSTVPIGINEHVESIIRRGVKTRGLDDELLHFASNPEFLRQGKALSDTFYPDRIVVGTNDNKAFEMLASLYDHIVRRDFKHPSFLQALSKYPSTKIMRTDRVSAEMIKYASNAFLALKISYINEIAGLCEHVGADVNDVSIGMGYDERIAPAFLKAGLGWGGSCFPKDTIALLQLAKDYSYHMPIIEAARQVNAAQVELIASKILRELKTLQGKKIALLGISFKPLTDDVRNSPAIDVAFRLQGLGAQVYMHDPICLENARKVYEKSGLHFVDTVEEAATDAQCVALVTDWQQYRKLDWHALSQIVDRRLFVDSRNFIDKSALTNAGWQYIGFGR